MGWAGSNDGTVDVTDTTGFAVSEDNAADAAIETSGCTVLGG